MVNRHTLVVMFSALFCAWTLCAQPLHTSLDQHIQRYVEDEQFRGVVLVAKDHQVLFHKAYGPANEASREQNTTDTRFLIGSLTKSMTAVAAMRLVEQGKLDLHRPLEQYIPALAPHLRGKLTIHLLLKHQSGLPVHLERLISFSRKDVSTDEILDVINTTSPAFVPGSRYQYGNLNYHLVAIALENIAGKPFPQLMSELVFAPLGMKQSGVERLAHPAPDAAQGYRKSAFGLSPDSNIVSYAVGSGDVYSTTGDLFLWDQALYQDEFLSQRSKALLFEGETKAFGYYGYGFRVQPYQRRESQPEKGVLARHGGSMDGFYSNLHRYMDDQLTVIVLANVRPFPIRNLTFELKELTLGVAVGTRARENGE